VILLFSAFALAALMIAIARFARHNYIGLPELLSVETSDPVDHVVIIPARDEAPRIARAVKSFPDSGVVVVDDHSTDATAEIAAAAGAHVRQAEPLQANWKGKPNACWTGALYTDSKWILFVDADTWYEPAFLPALLDYAVSENLAALSVFPNQHRFTFFENLLLPYAFGIYFSGVDPTRVNDPLQPEALANGQCLLVRREAYEFIQGHRAVVTSAVEDVALARLFKRHRMKIRVMRAEKLAHARMYESLGAIWRGFEKNSFKFLKLNRRTAFRVVVSATLMTSWLPMLAILIHAGHLTAAVAFFFVPALAWLPWYGLGFSALLAPFAIYLFQLIAISAMVKDFFGIGTNWKGRHA
jgi:glycosyltransferase involved in cell wall biosynthesis